MTMLHTTLRRRGLPVALAAGLAAAAAVTAYTAAALAHAPAAPEAPATLALLCALVGPPLPAAGAALAPAALAVMAPCLLQLAVVLATTTAGVAATGGAPPLRAGLAFAGGFLGVYGLAAVAVGLAGASLAAWAPPLQVAGGFLMAGLGLAVLRVLPRGARPGCRGPRWLILTGRANMRRPLGAGAAFAVYCLGCCGPYLGGLALLGAGAGSPLGGMALVAGFALLMGALLMLPLLSPRVGRAAQATLQRHGQPIALVSGAALTALGVAIALEPILIAAFANGLA